MGQSSQTQGIPKTHRNSRENKKENPRCATHNNKTLLNAAWQGVYPYLSALNQLFSTQQATAADAGQPSPWINFLASLGLQPIPGGQTPQQQQQARPEQEQPSAPPAPETERHEGHTYAGANSAAWRQPQHQASPGASQQPRDYSCGYSCGAPHISQLLQTITNRLVHFSSVATRASVTFFCIIAFSCFLSSLPGFLIQSALYVVLATSLLRLPLPTVLAGHLLLCHLLPPPHLRPLPPPALPAQAACSRPASWRSR